MKPGVKNYMDDIDNRKCVLASFSNEKDDNKKNLIKTGFLCWLPREDQKNITNIIKKSTEVIINWPTCEVQPAKLMKKQKNAKFEECVVIILAYGGKLYKIFPVLKK